MLAQVHNTVPFLKFLRDVVCQTLKVHGKARMRPGVALTIWSAAGNSIRQDERVMVMMMVTVTMTVTVTVVIMMMMMMMIIVTVSLELKLTQSFKSVN